MISESWETKNFGEASNFSGKKFGGKKFGEKKMSAEKNSSKIFAEIFFRRNL